MLAMGYELSGEWNKVTSSIDLSACDETTLRYQALLGDITLIANSCDYSTKWGWVPIVDFAASMRIVVGDLRRLNEGESVFEFTESDAQIRFTRIKESVSIRANYTECTTEVLLAELVDAVNTLCHDMQSDLLTRYPRLQENRVFCQLLGAEAARGCASR
jgi:hypothetical protein